MEVRRVSPLDRGPRKVAAYARVSTLTEEQEESYNTQVEYYTRLIGATPGWQFMGVYADKGISGSQMSQRPEFQRMMEDARNHRMDIILVKSISRFARNASEANEAIHRLRNYGVEVRFDREGISSMDPSAEMVFNVLSSIAQEELRSLSEKVKWTNNRLLEQGIRHLGNNHILGYDEVDGVLVPNADAWKVRLIFRSFADGLTTYQIADLLNTQGVKSLRGVRFSGGMIRAMLMNSTFVGDRLLQKKPPTDYMTHRPDYTQEYDSVFLSEDHEGIVPRELWNMVQSRLESEAKEREGGVHRQTRTHWLYGKVFCPSCGRPYVRATETLCGERVAKWKCSDRMKGKKGNGCRNAIVKETELMLALAGRLGVDVGILMDVIGRIDRVYVLSDGSFDIRICEVETAETAVC